MSEIITQGIERIEKETISLMLEKLIELRNLIHDEGGNTNVIDWIDYDIDFINILYLGNEPDGDNEIRISEDYEKISFTEAFNIIMIRFTNTR